MNNYFTSFISPYDQFLYELHVQDLLHAQAVSGHQHQQIMVDFCSKLKLRKIEIFNIVTQLHDKESL